MSSIFSFNKKAKKAKKSTKGCGRNQTMTLREAKDIVAKRNGWVNVKHSDKPLKKGKFF